MSKFNFEIEENKPRGMNSIQITRWNTIFCYTIWALIANAAETLFTYQKLNFHVVRVFLFCAFLRSPRWNARGKFFGLCIIVVVGVSVDRSNILLFKSYKTKWVGLVFSYEKLFVINILNFLTFEKQKWMKRDEEVDRYSKEKNVGLSEICCGIVSWNSESSMRWINDKN